MSEKWDITEEGSVVIKQTAVFDLKSFPRLFRDWALENNYFFNEKDFTEKVKGDGREYTIKFYFERKINPFIKSVINVEVKGLRVNDVKVKDKILQKGELNIVFDAVMEMDWQERWEGNPVTKFLRYVYIYYLKKKYFLGYAEKLWSDVYNLHAKFKTHLNQFSFM